MSGNFGGIYESFLSRCIGGVHKEQETLRAVAKLSKDLHDLEARGKALALQGGREFEEAEKLEESYRKGQEIFEKEGDGTSVLLALGDLVRCREKAVKELAEELQRQEATRRAQEEEKARLKREEEAKSKHAQENAAMHKAATALAAAAKVAAEEASKAEWEIWRSRFKDLGWVLGAALGLYLLLVATPLDWGTAFGVMVFFVGIPIGPIIGVVLNARWDCDKDERLEYRKEKRANLVLSNLMAQMVPIPGKNFMMGKYAVTQAQWKALIALQMRTSEGENPAYYKGANKPVTNVAQLRCDGGFTTTINHMMPVVGKSGLEFRLPTEEEWKFACRAGAKGDYCRLADGTEITKETLGQVAWFKDNSGKKTHRVGKKKPNAFGLYDMLGNVLEWTSTRKENETGTGWDFVLCGGNYETPAEECKLNCHSWADQFGEYCNVGFRLACSLAEQETT